MRIKKKTRERKKREGVERKIRGGKREVIF